MYSFLFRYIRLVLFFVLMPAPTFVAYAQSETTVSTSTTQTATLPLLDIQKVTAASGLSAWLVEDHTLPIIAVNFTFKGKGARNDPQDKQGLAQLASNTMDEGAGSYDSRSFQKTLNDYSITLRFNSGRDHFGGTLKTLSKNKEKAFELLTLALNKPRFDEDPVNRMRAANQSRIRSSLSDPDWMAARIINDRGFEGHSYANNSGGTLSSLDNIKSEDLHEFSKGLSKDSLVITTTGDISAQELEAILDQVFASLPQESETQSTTTEAENSISLENQGQTYLFKQDIPQTVVEIRQNGIDRSAPDFHTAQVMNFILGSSGFGSRLTKSLREERGLTYGIYTYFADLDEADLFAVSTSTKSDSVKEALGLIKEEWTRMKDTIVSEEELRDAKSYLIGSLPLSMTSTDSINALAHSIQVDGLPADYLEQRQKKIESVTAEDIQNFAQSFLNEDSFLTVLVGKPLLDDVTKSSIQMIEELPNVR